MLWQAASFLTVMSKLSPGPGGAIVQVCPEVETARSLPADLSARAFPGRAARSRAALGLWGGDDGHRTRGHTMGTHD